MNQESAARSLPFVWADYRSWDDDHRWEIIDGEAYAMSPAPTTRHQTILVELTAQFSGALRGRCCRPYVSPTDVKLSETDVVQPDLLVVCNPDQIKPTHIDGAPTLVVEVLSPSTAQRDRGIKMDAYARAGVQEVWLVTPWPQCVELFVLQNDRYVRHGAFIQTDTLKSPTVSELEIDLAPVFDFPLDPGEEPPEVKEPPGRYTGECISPRSS